jgi:hypothetical protein
MPAGSRQALPTWTATEYERIRMNGSIEGHDSDAHWHSSAEALSAVEGAVVVGGAEVGVVGIGIHHIVARLYKTRQKRNSDPGSGFWPMKGLLNNEFESKMKDNNRRMGVGRGPIMLIGHVGLSSVSGPASEELGEHLFEKARRQHKC